MLAWWHQKIIIIEAYIALALVIVADIGEVVVGCVLLSGLRLPVVRRIGRVIAVLLAELLI